MYICVYNIGILQYNKRFGEILQSFFSLLFSLLEAIALPQALMAALQTTVSIGPEPLADRFVFSCLFQPGGV